MRDGSSQVWALSGDGVIDLIRKGSGTVGDLAFSPDGRHVAGRSVLRCGI
jgi:hypothetical protein